MKAYTKTIKGHRRPLTPLTRPTRLVIAIQYALLSLSVAGYGHAQETSLESAKKFQTSVPATEDNAESSATESSRSGEKASKEKTSPTQDATQRGETTESAKPSETVLPTLVIREKGVQEGYGVKNSMTATKTKTPIIEVPQSISVINRNELTMRGVNLNFTEALRYVPGVVADTLGFNGTGFEYVSMRGFNSLSTANFRDNLSQQGRGFFFADFITDPYSLERVDVLRGPTSVTFGRGDAGGIINRVTKLPTSTPIREVELQYGNFDRKRIAGDFGLANEDGTLMFRLVTSALDTDTQVRFPNTGGDRAQIRRFYIAPSLTWRPTDRTSVTLFGDILNNRSEAAAFYVATPEGSPTNTLLGEPNFTRYSSDQASFSYKLEHHFNDTFTVRQNFRFMSLDGRYRDINPAGFAADGRTLDRSSVATRERLDQTVLDTHVEARTRTGPLNHTVLAGIDWNRVESTLNHFIGSAPSIDIFNPVYNQPVPTPDFLFIDGNQKIDQVGFYVQDQIKFNQWVLTLSGRHDRVSSVTNVNIFDPQHNASKDSAYTGRAGLTYLFSNGIAPYFSYSQSFLPQYGIDFFNNTPFKPARASQYEVGIKYQPPGTRNLFTAALFELTKTNVLIPDPRTPLGVSQAGEIRSRGAEVEARTEIYRGMNLIGAFTYNDVKVTESATGFIGNMPVRVPNLTTSAWLDYNLGTLNVSWLKGFFIGGGVRYVGRVFNDEANTSTTPSFTLFDAMLRYDHGPWQFLINANNIFDDKYYSASTGGNFFLGTRRSVIGTLKLRF
ncbi:iron complex outermembrane receptor protein [Nitrosospira multiformis]|uniref:Iron complex outermembrane receptor protein n=1 Tax=Nitrosospira multiformis TaxID=1231 RepID=A0A2T5I8F7_9PROT|nr:TonB-dependent siderophore receptor [Nitrosospira multiformis]PTQ80110.1 iron complex outermembrane receptor protein [Nitrosospira multiformis]